MMINLKIVVCEVEKDIKNWKKNNMQVCNRRRAMKICRQSQVDHIHSNIIHDTYEMEAP